MSHFLAPVFEVGFFESEAVLTAVIIGAAVALVAGAVGVFTVMRGQSFAAEAFGDIGTTGGSGAFLIGAGPLLGFLVFGALAAGAMELVGHPARARARPGDRDRARRGARSGGPVPVPRQHHPQHERRRRDDPVRIDLHDQQLDDPARGGARP